MRVLQLPKDVASVFRIEATDEPVNGVYHHYQIYGKANGQWEKLSTLKFKKTYSEAKGPDGVIPAVVLNILMDHLNKVRDKPQGEQAVNRIKEALMWLDDLSEQEGGHTV